MAVFGHVAYALLNSRGVIHSDCDINGISGLVQCPTCTAIAAYISGVELESLVRKSYRNMET